MSKRGANSVLFVISYRSFSRPPISNKIQNMDIITTIMRSGTNFCNLPLLLKYFHLFWFIQTNAKWITNTEIKKLKVSLVFHRETNWALRQKLKPFATSHWLQKNISTVDSEEKDTKNPPTIQNNWGNKEERIFSSVTEVYIFLEVTGCPGYYH